MMGSEYGAFERSEETVDLPVAIEPVRPRRSMADGYAMHDLFVVVIGRRSRRCTTPGRLRSHRDHDMTFCGELELEPRKLSSGRALVMA